MSITQKYFLLGKLRVLKPQAVNNATAFLNPYMPLPHIPCICALALGSVSVKQWCARNPAVSDAWQDRGFGLYFSSLTSFQRSLSSLQVYTVLSVVSTWTPSTSVPWKQAPGLQLFWRCPMACVTPKPQRRTVTISAMGREGRPRGSLCKHKH